MHRLPLLCLAPLCVACATAEIEVPTDADHDGLLSDLELELGTDPDVADSDGDGHSDGDEVSEGFDPLDVEDHPYLGGYPVNRCETNPTPSGTGGEIGDVWADFEALDQYGENVRLYDFCNSYVYFEAGSFT